MRKARAVYLSGLFYYLDNSDSLDDSDRKDDVTQYAQYADAQHHGNPEHRAEMVFVCWNFVITISVRCRFGDPFFLLIFLSARQNSFNNVSSLGKASRFLVILRRLMFIDSIALVM